jgi:hypothetical protein
MKPANKKLIARNLAAFYFPRERPLPLGRAKGVFGWRPGYLEAEMKAYVAANLGEYSKPTLASFTWRKKCQ